MPVLILLERAMNRTKSDRIYFVFLKNEMKLKKWWELKKPWSELDLSYHHRHSYTAFEMLDNISWSIIPELLKPQIPFLYQLFFFSLVEFFNTLWKMPVHMLVNYCIYFHFYLHTFIYVWILGYWNIHKYHSIFKQFLYTFSTELFTVPSETIKT